MRKKKTTEKKHKVLGTKLFFAGLLGLAGIATVVAILFLVPINHGTEEEHVIDVVKRKAKIAHPAEKALEALWLELDDSENPFLTGQGVEKQLNKMTTGNITMDYSLNISNAPQLDGATIGADGAFIRDMDAQKMYLHTDISVSRMKMLLADLYGQEDKLYLCLPEITGEDTILLGTENIDKQYNDSRLCTYIGKQIPFEVSVYPYTKLKLDVPRQVWVREFLKEMLFGEDFDRDDIEIELDEIDRTDSEDTLKVGEKELKLRTYRVAMHPGNAFFEVALDKNKNVRIIRFPETFECSGATIEGGTICFLGEESITEKVDANLELTIPFPEQIGIFEEGNVHLRLDAEIEENLSLYMVVQQETAQVSFSGQIGWEDLETLCVDIRYLTAKQDDKDIMKITGMITVDANVTQMPASTGEIVDVLHMNDMELLVTFMPWAKNIEKRYGAFLEFMGE